MTLSIYSGFGRPDDDGLVLRFDRNYGVGEGSDDGRVDEDVQAVFAHGRLPLEGAIGELDLDVEPSA